MNRSSKITRSHLERAALIYIRQSTLAQVQENTESTARQYALGDAAVALGWDRGDVQIIDADLGRSGRSAQGRDGYRELVSQVCLGEVGAIFGLEISRLARSTADLSRLLELARLTDTLVIDGDGVYDLTGPATNPSAPNGPSTPPNPRTGSSPATSKPAGRTSFPASPRPRMPWTRPETPFRPHPIGPRWKPS